MWGGSTNFLKEQVLVLEVGVPPLILIFERDFHPKNVLSLVILANPLLKWWVGF
jgi:hypothetical protein